jgi:hypothetical protein
MRATLNRSRAIAGGERNGAFAPSCHDHTGNIKLTSNRYASLTTIDGVHSYAALGEWYHGGGDDHVRIEPRSHSGLPYNPGCKHLDTWVAPGHGPAVAARGRAAARRIAARQLPRGGARHAPPTKTAAELRAEERQAKREKGLAERAQRDREWRENREQWRKEQTKVSSAKVRRGGRHSADGVVDGTPMPSICRNPAIAKRVKKCQTWSVHA